MATIHRQLRTAVARMSTRPLPSTWTEQEPHLARYPSVGEMVTAVRYDSAGIESDEILRALARTARHDPDAVLVALQALLPTITRSISPYSKAQFRREILTDLAVVILEIDDIDQLDRVAVHLVKRAHRRAVRRIETETRFRDHKLDLDEALDAPALGIDMEDQVADRIQLQQISRDVAEAIKDGRMSARTWAAFCDGKLRPELTGQRVRVDRRATYAAIQVVRGQFEHTC